MARSKYIGVKANFTNYSLVIESSNEFETINEDWADESGGEYKRCECPFCKKELTINQYETGKLVEYNPENGDLKYSFAHKECLEKSKQ